MTDQLIREVLDEYGGLTRDLVQKTLPDAEPYRYLYGPLAEYPTRGGKMLRPALCIAAARCFGASLDAAVAVAASIELFHNALLVHDDIEDESESRRGGPALHVKYGVPIALNAGDMLAFLSFRPIQSVLPRVGPILASALISDFQKVAQETAEGQALELGWRFDNTENVTPGDYFEMVLKKTCWLTSIFPCRAGAMLGKKCRLEASHFVRFGFFAGAAFQIKDDLMNIKHHAEYGKERCGDLYEGKRTLMLIDLLARMQEKDRARLFRFLGLPRKDRPSEDIVWISQSMASSGCLERAQMTAEALVDAADSEFEKAFGDVPETQDKAFIRSIPKWMLSRSR